jgi:hypothetical protein
MTSIENLHFGIGYVAPVCLGFFDLERRVEATPQNQERRLEAAEPLLPRGITGDVGPVVIEQVHLDVALAGTAQERELVYTEVGVLQRYVRASSHVPLACGIEGQEVRPQSRLVAGAVGPEITTGVP